jgi:hypothetical protein
MRAYGSVVPRFWTGGTGKKLRGHKEAQLVAFWLMTAPATTMVGIFNLALPTLCHETGLTEDEARAGLAKCEDEGFAYFDEADELVWVPSLSKIQLGEELKVGSNGKADHRVAGVRRALAPFKHHRFYGEFLKRYGEAYKLLPQAAQAPSEPLPSVRKPLQRGDVPVPDPVHDHDHDHDHDPDPERGDDPEGEDDAPPDPPGTRSVPPGEVELPERAKLWFDDAQRASLEFPHPETWPEVVFLETTRATVFKSHPNKLRNAGDPRVEAALARFAERYTVEQLAKAIRGAALDDHVQRNPQFQTLNNILKNAAQVDRFMAIADKPPRPRAPHQRHGPVQQTGTDPFHRHREQGS